MNDNEINKLFEDYRPQLSSDGEFMSRLVRQLDAVEFIRNQQVSRRRRNRLGIVAAAISGCIVGVIATLISPWIMIACISMVGMSEMMADVTTWALVGVFCLVTIFAVYDMCSSPIKKIKASPAI